MLFTLAYLCMHTSLYVHAHTKNRKQEKMVSKKPKYDINKAESAEPGNAKPHANRLCTHLFVKTDLWTVYHIFKAHIFLLFYNPESKLYHKGSYHSFMYHQIVICQTPDKKELKP